MDSLNEKHFSRAKMIKDDFEEIAESYEKLDSFSRCYDRYFLEHFPDGNLNILDVGAGIGGQAETSIRARNRDKWTLVDISPKMVSLAQNRNVNNSAIESIIAGDIFTGSIELPQKAYDVIIANKVFHDYPIAEYLLAIDVLFGYLKKDGVLIIGDVTGFRSGFLLFLDAAGELFWRLKNTSVKDVIKYYTYLICSPSKRWTQHLKKEQKPIMQEIGDALRKKYLKSEFRIIHPHYYLFSMKKG